MTIIILLLFILLIITYINNIPKIEHYDILYNNYNLNACAKTCRDTASCYAFAYNKTTGQCYLSQDVITGKPPDAIYKDDYNPSNLTCNKYNPILSESQNPTLDERRGNSIYVCSESDSLYPQIYFYNDNNFKNIGEGRNIDNIFNIDTYSVKSAKWPQRYDKTGELALLKDTKQKFQTDNISDIERILQDENKPTPLKITAPPSQITETIKSDFGTLLNKLTAKSFIPLDRRTLPKTNVNLVYQLSDKLNTGDYLHQYGCIKNISKEKCLKYCTDDLSCVGTEWNPSYNGAKDVCCPYKKVDKFIDRSGDEKNGNFYEKKYEQNLDKNNIYIKVYE